MQKKDGFCIFPDNFPHILERLLATTYHELLREVSKHGIFSGPYFPVFSLNTGKYGQEKNSVFGHFSRIEF